MRRSSSSLVALAGSLGVALPVAALAQRSSTIEIHTRRDGTVECFRDDRRVSCESIRAEGRRAERRAADARRRRYEDLRPRVGLGAGADIRRFADVNRYLGQIGVDFHTRFGLGLRPEVMYAWSDRQRELLPTVVCPACNATANTAPIELRSRSQMLGVNLNATYAFLRGSAIRPYLVGGVGVFSTRASVPVVASGAPLAGSTTITQLTYRTDTHDRTDLGLNAGAGLEFGRGPVRLFTEFRYFLNDTASPRGFSGMAPISAGLRF